MPKRKPSHAQRRRKTATPAASCDEIPPVPVNPKYNITLNWHATELTTATQIDWLWVHLSWQLYAQLNAFTSGNVPPGDSGTALPCFTHIKLNWVRAWGIKNSTGKALGFKINLQTNQNVVPPGIDYFDLAAGTEDRPFKMLKAPMYMYARSTSTSPVFTTIGAQIVHVNVSVW